MGAPISPPYFFEGSQKMGHRACGYMRELLSCAFLEACWASVVHQLNVYTPFTLTEAVMYRTFAVSLMVDSKLAA